LRIFPELLSAESGARVAEVVDESAFGLALSRKREPPPSVQ